MSSNLPSTTGVQQLIDRLQQQGVEQGEQLAAETIAEAKGQATRLLQEAQQKSDQIVAEAEQEAERIRKSGEDAIRLAGRDTILKLTEELRENFVRKLQHLIQGDLQDTTFLRELILEIARHSMPPDSDGQVNVEVLHQRGSTAKHLEDEQALREFVKQLGAETLRDGLTMTLSEHDSPGVRVQFENDQLEVDLTTETMTRLLISNLSPRFREIVNEESPQKS